MYRVHGKDGNTYEAASLAVLQQWVGEGRIVQTTIIEDLLSGTQGPATEIEGLELHAAYVRPGTNGQVGSNERPSDFAMYLPLIKAVLSTLCFSPVGVAAVIYAAKIPEIVASGDLERARNCARISGIIANIAFLLGVLYYFAMMKIAKEMGLPL